MADAELLAATERTGLTFADHAWTEKDRLAALEAYAVLGSLPETAFDDIAQIASRTCAAPIALVSFVSEHFQWFKSEVGFGIKETPRDISFCAHAILQKGMFTVPDATEDERFSCNPLVTGEHHVRFYAGAVLRTDSGVPLGTVCVLDRKARPEGLTPEQTDTLEALARAVMRELESRVERRFFQVALGTMDQGLIMIGPDGRVPIINARAAELLDLPPDLVESKPLFKDVIRFQKERGEFETADSELRADTDKALLRPHRYDYERTRPDGTMLEVRTVPLDGGGAVRTFTDVTQRRRAEAAVREREARYRGLADALPQNVWVTDLDGNTIFTNKTMIENYGPIGTSVAERFSIFHPDDRPAILAAREAAASAEVTWQINGRARHCDGTYRWHRITLCPMHHEDELIGWLGVSLDMHDLRMAEVDLQDQKSLLRATLENIDQGLLMVDASDVVQVVNQRAIDLLDLPADLLRAKPLFADVVAYQEERGEIARYIEAGPDWIRTRQSVGGAPHCYERERPNGTVLEIRSVHLPEGGAVRTYSDITARKRAERELLHISRHDELTGLPTRRVLQERLEEGIGTLPKGRKLGLMLIDLDNFKDINDTLGHGAGDFALQSVATRLLTCLPFSAMAVRLGGDEFAILMPEVETEEAVDRLAAEILAALRNPLMYEQRDISRRTSIGIALCPDHGASAVEVTKNADIALYAAKRSGRDQAVFYSSEFGEAARQRVQVLRNARNALSMDGILPFYQPKVALASGEVVGFEALLRWQHPDGGLRSPAEIQEAFDDPELGVALGQRMLHKIVADMQVWKNADCRFGSVALNIANPEFLNANFAKNVMATLAAAGLGPECLEVEVTESVLLGAAAKGIRNSLQTFHDGGIAVALDDFGTGYASLSHLNEFPLTWLKIDRSFVEDIGANTRAEAIVQGVLGLAHSLSIGVVAEGIETVEQMEFLRQRNCELGQGFLFAKPMIGSRVPNFLEKWTPMKPENDVGRVSRDVRQTVERKRIGWTVDPRA
jgi:diguanylate cyclase (GGDEF)-like protein/PAS domain S-box-containing protein